MSGTELEVSWGLFGWFGLQAITGGERKVRGSAENAALLRRERVPVLLGVDELVALFRRQTAHAADLLIYGLAAVGRQLLELLKKLPRSLLLIRSQVFPRFHASENAFLLLRRQIGKTLQPVSQPRLLLWRQLAKLSVVLEFAALLFRCEISIPPQPVSGVAGLILPRT